MIRLQLKKTLTGLITSSPLSKSLTPQMVEETFKLPGTNDWQQGRRREGNEIGCDVSG